MSAYADRQLAEANAVIAAIRVKYPRRAILIADRADVLRDHPANQAAAIEAAAAADAENVALDELN